MILLILLFVSAIFIPDKASPKKYATDNGNFLPSQIKYYESDLPDEKPSSVYNNSHNLESKESSDRLQRFGLPVSTYGNTGSGVQNYPGSGVGYMTPTKIDIGGIALGALLGLGAILIVPKLAHIFSSGYGYRSIENDMSSLTEILSKVDNSLEQHNIDSSSCMQRVICDYVQEAQKNMHNGNANTVDQVVLALSNNTLFSYLLEGTAIKQAIEMGKQSDAEKCSSLYLKCPINKDNIGQVIGNLLPS